MSLKEELQRLLAGEVTDDPQALDAASRDASLFEIEPRLVVAPADSADLQKLVRFVAAHPEEKLSLTARSGGTDMTGGPLTRSIVVDMKPHFNHIVEVGDHFAITEPGVYYRDFEKATLKKKLLLPSFPASREICTVGGMASNNSGGELTPIYGKTEQFVEELRMVWRDGQEHVVRPLTMAELEAKKREPGLEGEVYARMHKLIDDNYDLLQEAKPKVTKNSAGYYLWNVLDKEKGIFDLNKLFVGAQGTLGITTRIRYRLVTPKKHSRLLVIFLPDLEKLPKITPIVMGFKPASFESYDDNTLKLAFRFFPEIAKFIAKRNLFAVGLQFLPEMGMLLRLGKLPKLVLMAEFIGDSVKEINATLERLQAALEPLDLVSEITKSDGANHKYWVIRRESFNLLRHHIRGKHTAPFIDDIVVRPELLPQFLPQLEKLMKEYRLIYTIAGHVGDGNFHIIPLMDLKDPRTKEIISKLSDEVYDLVLRYGGSITGEHNDGLIRSPYLYDMYGPKVYRLFEETKAIFDPDNIFNPGKKVHANKAYAFRHFIKDADAS